MTIDEFQKAVIAYAKEIGLEAYELYYAEQASESVTAMAGRIEEFSGDVVMGATFRCVVNGKTGYCSTELFTDEEARRIVCKAAENAAVIESEEEAILFGGSDSYAEVCNPEPESVDMRALALSLQEKAMQYDPKVQKNSEAAVSVGKGSIRLVNSCGLDLSNTYSHQIVTQEVLVREGEEQYNSYSFSDKPFSELDPDALTKEAADSALDMIRTGFVPSGKYKVVFSGRAFASILAAFSGLFSAKNAQQGMSLLAGKEGKVIASDNVTILDDPFYADSPKTPFDGEGVATFSKKVVDAGVFKTFLYNLASAKKAGVESTGNGSRASYFSPVGISPYTFYLKPGEKTEEEIFEEVGDGIQVTQMAGMHAGLNPISGDFSLSSSGYRIENGKKAGYISQFTVSGNFFSMLKNVAEVGSDLKFGMPHGFTRIGSPSVYIKELSVAGK